MRRVSVVGNSGSGKSWLARRLAERLGVPYLELDAVYHQPGWVPLPDDELRAAVGRFTAGPGWVVDGNYSAVREDMVWPRADTVVWLDLPRRVVFRQVVGRTLARATTRRELWNGNRERWRNMLSLDPQRSIIMWSWTRHHRYRRRYQDAARDPRWAHLRFVRLRSRRQVSEFLAGR
ncbi:MAG TPA: hypothetical protein VIS06_05325 [Mycobacteriales bacterium]